MGLGLSSRPRGSTPLVASTVVSPFQSRMVSAGVGEAQAGARSATVARPVMYARCIIKLAEF